MKAMLILTGVILILVGLLVVYYKRNFYQKAQKTTGKVTPAPNNSMFVGRTMGVKYLQAIRFKTHKGEVIDLPTDKLKPGEEVPVLYNPDIPYQGVLVPQPPKVGFWLYWTTPALCGLAGILLLLFAMLLKTN